MDEQGGTGSKITYKRGDTSDYVARDASDGRTYRVSRTPWHMVTSHYFDWQAERAGRRASGPTRDAAVRAVIAMVAVEKAKQQERRAARNQ